MNINTTLFTTILLHHSPIHHTRYHERKHHTIYHHTSSSFIYPPYELTWTSTPYYLPPYFYTIRLSTIRVTMNINPKLFTTPFFTIHLSTIRITMNINTTLYISRPLPFTPYLFTIHLPSRMPTLVWPLHQIDQHNTITTSDQSYCISDISTWDTTYIEQEYL